MIKKVFTMKFGEITVKEIFKVIYVIGLIVIIIGSIFVADNSIFKLMQLFKPTYMFYRRTILLAAVSLIISVIFMILWKLCCELLYLIFYSLETYIKKNNP